MKNEFKQQWWWSSGSNAEKCTDFKQCSRYRHPAHFDANKNKNTGFWWMRAGRPRLLPIECDNTRTNGIGTKEWVVRNSHPILDLVRQKMELLVEEVPVCRCFRGTITRAHSTTERIVGGSVGRLAGQYCWAEWSAFQQSRTRTEPSVSTGKKKKRSNPTHDTCIVFLANSITQIQNHQPKIFILANVYYPHWHIVMWCRRYSMDTLYLYSWIVFYDVDLYMYVL